MARGSTTGAEIRKHRFASCCLPARWLPGVRPHAHAETKTMLRLAPAAPALRVQADGARLPLRDSSAAAVVLINAFLFPAEVERILSPAGALVWVNSSGEQTPIYLSVDDLVAGLTGEWTGTSSRAGEGLWCVLRRRRG